ncbi:universal stress protein [Pseudomonas sp. 43(2021)]|uniref:universal stress protein n=1 Tax=Pseudomonas sp. 43(2021) TaxID=2813560 RepID=UPI001FAEF8CD|nr:universal stress protein [Pseudomonas sp. 43(2021)]
MKIKSNRRVALMLDYRPVASSQYGLIDAQSRQKAESMKINHLLLIAPCDDRYSPAVELSAELAMAMDASVSLAALPALSLGAQKLSVESYLKQRANNLASRGLGIGPDVMVLKPTTKSVTTQITLCNADLVVMDHAADSAVRQADLDLKLLEKTPCPVLFAREHVAPRLEKLFVAAPASCEDLDERALNTHVIEVAKAVCQARKGRMHLFSVYDQAALLRHSEQYSLADIPRYETLAATCKAFVGQLGISTLQHHLIVGSCAHSICAYANRCEYDLVVIANAHNPRQHETLRYLLSHLKCSLLVVNAPDRKMQQASEAWGSLDDPLLFPA